LKVPRRNVGNRWGVVYIGYSLVLEAAA